jgi:hypothetical protein
MEFKKVTELVPGTKYQINLTFLNYRGIYTHSVRKGMHNFVKINGRNNFQAHFYNETFYEPVFQKERIQTNMEHRAVNKLLQKIIGDPSFSW